MRVFECFAETVDYLKKKSCICFDTNLNRLNSWQKLGNPTPGEKKEKHTHSLKLSTLVYGLKTAILLLSLDGKS